MERWFYFIPKHPNLKMNKEDEYKYLKSRANHALLDAIFAYEDMMNHTHYDEEYDDELVLSTPLSTVTIKNTISE